MHCTHLKPESPTPRHLGAQRGFSMIEVLVTMMIIALALLGAAGLQANALRINKSGESRVQAVFLAADLAERLEANRAGAVDGVYAVANSSTPSDSGSACDTSACNASQLADFDLSQWEYAVSQTLPQASWTVAHTTTGNPSTYTISIRWVDRRSNTNYNSTGTNEELSYETTRTVLNN